MKHQVLRGIELIAVGEASLLKAQEQITGCQACTGFASRPFQSVLAQLLENGGATEYFLCSPVECPRCASPILETTLVTVQEEHQTAETWIFEPLVEATNVVFVDEPTLLEAQRFVSGCEHCSPESAEITFDYLLDVVTSCDPTITEYVICHAAKCPRCRHEVMEKTLIIPA